MNKFALKTNNGVVEYMVDDLDFINIMCDLEEKNIDIMAMMNGESGGRTFTFLRGIVAMLLGEDERTAGKKLSEHIRNGGTLDDVMETFAGLMNAAGFGEAEQTETEVPQEIPVEQEVVESNITPLQN